MAPAQRHRAGPGPWGSATAAALVVVLGAALAPGAGGATPPAGAAAGLGPGIGGLAFDAAGRLYVADRRHDRVVVLGRADEVLGEVGAGRLDAPTGVAVGADGDVLVSDAGGVQRFAPDGTLRTAWAADRPSGLAAAGDGTVYVSELGRVARFSAAGTRLGQWPAADPDGLAVAADGTLWVAVDGALAHFSATGAPLGRAPAGHPFGVAVAPDGSVLVAERARDRVARLRPDGASLEEVEDDLVDPRGLAVDCRGNVAVADDAPQRIHRIAAAREAPPCPAGAPAPVTAPVAPEPLRPLARRLPVTPLALPAPLPALGRSALATAAFGRVLVRAPGAAGLDTVAAGRLLTMGARLDTRAGRVRLTFATRTADFDRLGTTQTGDFDSGVFSIDQARTSSLVELRLAGAKPSCRLSVSGRAVGPRHLWADVHGSFRTRGVRATVTARNARWLTEDRCDGTLVEVTRGSVDVRDRSRRRTVRVAAGGRYLARPPAR